MIYPIISEKNTARLPSGETGCKNIEDNRVLFEWNRVAVDTGRVRVVLAYDGRVIVAL